MIFGWVTQKIVSCSSPFLTWTSVLLMSTKLASNHLQGVASGHFCQGNAVIHLPIWFWLQLLLLLIFLKHSLPKHVQSKLAIHFIFIPFHEFSKNLPIFYTCKNRLRHQNFPKSLMNSVKNSCPKTPVCYAIQVILKLPILLSVSPLGYWY